MSLEFFPIDLEPSGMPFGSIKWLGNDFYLHIYEYCIYIDYILYIYILHALILKVKKFHSFRGIDLVERLLIN